MIAVKANWTGKFPPNTGVGLCSCQAGESLATELSYVCAATPRWNYSNPIKEEQDTTSRAFRTHAPLSITVVELPSHLKYQQHLIWANYFSLTGKVINSSAIITPSNGPGPTNIHQNYKRKSFPRRTLRKMIWKFSSGGFVAIVTVAVWFSFGNPCEAFHSSVDLSNYDYNQLNAIVRDALRYLEKVKSQPRYDKLTGQVNSRSQRSDLVGDMAHALRLYQLQELDRMYGSKARPRFGKRAEVTLENVPTYGFEGNFNGGLSGEDRRKR
ncbi:unnamed protein product [Allacma fusca]|uniref:Uncharacterized protein n=1 Tax=Allacma fusca TaxID=39272 RepID=A0A8J2NWX2_9HEXA|nr:unnamed protein product [Allacma fusca]